MGNPRTLFHLFLTFQTIITIFTTKNGENDIPIHGAGTRTHNLQNMSLLRKSQDQGSRPNRYFGLIWFLTTYFHLSLK